jgi:hypothetical protein
VRAWDDLGKEAWTATGFAQRGFGVTAAQPYGDRAGDVVRSRREVEALASAKDSS